MIAEPESRPLRIALVYDCIFPASIGGIEHRNDELAKALSARGHHVTLAGWNPSGPETRHDGRVEVLPIGRPTRIYGRHDRRRPIAALRLAWHCLGLEVRRFDIIETANIPFLHLFPLAIKCAVARRPLIISWHEYWGPYWKEYLGGSLLWRLFALVESTCAQLGTLTTANSMLTLERLAAHRKKNSPRLLPGGIDLDKLDSLLASIEPERRNAGPPLVYAGRLLPEKRLPLLLHAVALVASQLQPQRPLLRIIGGGPDSERLVTLIAELAIAKYVELVGRLDRHDQVIEAVAEARIAVQPSRREGFGLFPLEAMAMSMPVVYCASTESAVGRLVRNGKEGIEVEPHPEDLAAAIERLLVSREECERLGQGARTRAVKYSWTEISKQAEGLFREAVALRSNATTTTTS